ncbi:uncharacterized protein LOC110989882 [Acanthaster planci]|uniref:Uncharacterized protein LOC110989882 n=1 Tax=Acanthaster planci TaxID=133434 RepID=A0A8B7ZXX7_ACAPL|nr:uncharacterized protein LOC110989882 [Acanthaster planci]
MSARRVATPVVLQTILAAVSAAVVFLDSPEDLVLAAGNTAVLRCSVEPQGTEREPVKWVHLESNRILSEDSVVMGPTRDKYSVVRNHGGGEYTLKISAIQLGDEGEYRCMCGSEYRSAVLTVVVPPDAGYPLCHVQPNPTKQRPGGTAELSCTSHGGTPPADLVWHRGDLLISDVTTQANALQHMVTASDNGVRFTCFAKSKAPSLPVRKCETMVLNIPPEASISPQLHVVQPGESVTYTCAGAGIPAVTGYRWLVNYIDVTGEENRGQRYKLLDDNRTLRITDARSWEDGALIACEVSTHSGLIGRAWAKLSINSPPVMSTTKEVNPGLLLPTTDNVPIENDKKKIGPTVLKPQTNSATAGVVAGAILATVGIILALVVIAILLTKTKASGQFSMATANKKKCFEDKPGLSTGTIKKMDECPIYAKPDKLRKGPAPVPPSAAAPAPECALATQKKKARKNHHSYEKVDILGCSLPGQAYTLPVRLQSKAPATPTTRRSDTSRLLKAQAPPPPGFPLPPLPRKSPVPTPQHPPNNELLYADLDLPATRETINQSHNSTAGVDYAILPVHNSVNSGGYDWGTS